MKKFTLTLFAVLGAFAMNAQIVINEILYNIPGSGEDEEFIELLNTSSSDVDVSNWTFTQGVTFTFPANYSIAAGDYFVLASDSAAFHTSFGFAADTVWTSGALSNGGEDIIIRDATSMIQDSVNYNDAAPWPTEADGGGYSLQLCDSSADNSLAEFWTISTDSTGYNTVTGIEALYATPGQANNVACPVPNTDPLPMYMISEIDGVNTDGVADSLNVDCAITGIVHCGNYRPGGLEFTVIESSISNIGIKVFAFSVVDNYTVTQGDSLRIVGSVSQFNGHLRFDPDTIQVLSSGHNIVDSMVVTELNEMTENKYIAFENGYLVDASQWTGTGSGFNVDVTNGSDTILVRVDADIALYNEAAPTDTFTVIGLGGQYDSSSPYDSGYQLMACHLIMDTTGTTTPTPTVIPSYTISEIDGINANGVADSLNVVCQITGIVHCQDFRGGAGIEFTVMESSTQNVGIEVFSFQDVDNYVVTEGDELRLVGNVAQFNGHLQFSPDTIEVLSQGNATVTPIPVTELNEFSENKLIEIENLSLVDATQWTGSGSGFNVDVTNGTNTMTMRIDNDSPLYSEAAPATTFSVIGLGGQYDSSEPHTEGYEVYPCSLTEVQDTTDTSSLLELNGIKFNVFPNPVTNILNIVIESTDAFDVQVINLAGQVILTEKVKGTATIDVSELTAGFYTINFVGNNGTATTRLIKQ